MVTINVDRLELEKSGTRGNKPWNLFVVHGTHDDGTPLVNVKTFDSLPQGAVDVKLDPYTSDAGQSFTAKLNDSKRPRPKPRQDSSSEFEADVLKRLDRIERLLKLVITQRDDESEEDA